MQQKAGKTQMFEGNCNLAFLFLIYCYTLEPMISAKKMEKKKKPKNIPLVCSSIPFQDVGFSELPIFNDKNILVNRFEVFWKTLAEACTFRDDSRRSRVIITYSDTR